MAYNPNIPRYATGWSHVIKTTDEIITQDVVQSPDSQLTFPISASQRFIYEIQAYAFTHTTPALKYEMYATTAGSTPGVENFNQTHMGGTFGIIDCTTPIDVNVDAPFSSAHFDASRRTAWARLYCTYEAPSDAGNTVGLAWSQTNSSTEQTIMKAGSNIRYRRLT